MKKLFVLLTVLAIGAATVEAQNSARDVYTISGQVVDSLTNEAVPYATVGVAFAQTPTQFVKAMACDGNGKFDLQVNTPGDYLMTIQAVGIVTLLKPFTLTEVGKKTDFGKVQVRENVQKIGEVTVAAQKPLVKVEIDKLIYNMEEDPEAKVNNTLEMLRKVPMVTVDGEDNVLLKGASNFKVYLNGKESNLLSGQNMSQVLKSMPAGSVKNIEVITDPGARYDAEGIGGIINIVTTRNVFSGMQGSVSANASTFGGYGGSAYLTAKTGKLGVTGNFSYNRNKMPWGEAINEVENYFNDTYHSENSLGRTKRNGQFMFGHLEASYEFDTLNLLSLGVDLWNGNMNTITERTLQMLNINEALEYGYKQSSDSEGAFGQLGLNLDYQRSTHKKGENFTFSYRFNQSPDNSKSITGASDRVGDIPDLYYLDQVYDSDASTTEHTGQADYVNPLTDKHSIEAGLKYILRQNLSDVHQQGLKDGAWEELTKPERSDFKHISSIYAGYAGYAFKTKTWGFRTGLRAEGTKQNVEYRLSPAENFGGDYANVVPSVTVSYQLSPTQQLRAGYNLRISRPSIWYLNPYVNDTDPANISYGNPDLDPEKSNGFNLNYSYFSPKITLNVSGSYTYINNSIERYTFIDDAEHDIRQTTYANIGRSQRTGMFINAGWTPNKVLRFNINAGLNYTDMKASSTELTAASSGLVGNLYGNIQISLPKDFRINLNGMYNSGWVSLQGKQDPMYFTNIALNKDFLKKKFTVSLSCNSPFAKNMEFKYATASTDFSSVSRQYMPMRQLRLNVSFRFGSMKESIKKVQRGISNDDVKSGGSSSGGDTGGTSGGGM